MGEQVNDAGGARALEVSAVSKRFGEQRALDGVDFDLHPGEVHALVGHNGSGKSTLVKVLCGFHQPEEGAVAQAGGAPFALGDPHAAQVAGLRFVHQELGLVDHLGVVDNVVLGTDFPRRRLRAIDWPAARREVAALLTSLGYEMDVRQPVGSLSAIQRTGVAIARALHGAQPPRVLVLDEPTAALPAAGVAALFDVIRRLRATGIGIVYISHHLEEVFEIADRVTVLRDARRVATMECGSLTEDGLVELIVGGAVALDRAPRAVARREPTVLAVRGLAAPGLDALDLDVAAGEIVGIAGLAGSGRDSVAGALFGSIPRAGEVTVEGRTVAPGRPDLAIEAGLGLLAADRAVTGLIPNLSVRENLTLPRIDAALRGLFLSGRREARASRPWLERVDIRPRDPAKRVEHLSGGNQQKVLLARWLRALPRVLVIDEPTQGVDVGAVERIYAVIREAADQGTAFVVSSTNTDELVTLCTRVIVLNRGRVVDELTGSTIQRESIDRACLTNTTKAMEAV